MYQDHNASPYRTVGRSTYSTLAAFPVSCFILTLLTDLAYWSTASVLWETVSVWLLAVGLLGAAIAFVAGLVDLVRSRKARGLGQPLPRLVGHVVAVVLSVVNVLVHSRDGWTAVVPDGLILSAVTVLVLVVTALPVWSAKRRTPAQGLA